MERNNNYSTDAELIAAVRSGDHEAFRLLVEKYQDKITRISMGFVHSGADAEDIAQEVFIEVYQSIGKFRMESELSTWIYRIAVNKSLNFLRSASRRKLISFFNYSDSGRTIMENDTVAPPEFCPDQDLKMAEIDTAVKKAIDTLPSNQRKAFILSKYEDLSYVEIAKVMQVSIPSVESLLFRAKQALQKKLFIFYKKNIQ